VRHDPQLVEQLIRHEGLRLLPYMDTVGKITIGVGRNLSDVGVSKAEALILLDNDLDLVVADLASFSFPPTVNAVRRRVLENMRFNLGPTRFRGFRRFLAAVADGDFAAADKSMANSLWAQQVKGRATELRAMMRTGVDGVAV